MTTVVISQPFLFPWVGMWEQIQLADVYVHYDDVQFSKGHFVNRVQIKTAAGPKWMTIPVANNHLGTLINELETDERKNWRESHSALLADALSTAPYFDLMMGLFNQAYSGGTTSVDAIVSGALELVASHLHLDDKVFLRSSEMGIDGASSRRVLDVVHAAEGDVYVTGQGAKNYLDHDLFESEGVEVRYMDYSKTPYPQLHGEFTPFVSVLDLIANVGPEAPSYLQPRTVSWRDFMEYAQ